jgi:hypothetical protein
LIFEVFEFLDGCHIFEAFDKLNTRFQILLDDYLLPLNLNLSSHKSTFQHRCTAIVAPNLHRISALHLSNPLIIDHFLSTFTIDSSFSRLKALTFDEIKSSNVIPLLTDLASLPCLVYLSITVANCLKFRTDVYRLIFCLPHLKYCKLEFEFSTYCSPLAIANNVHSNIEHLSIIGSCRLDDLSAILSHTPVLRRLSCRLYEDWRTFTEVPIVPFGLTHASFELFNISFQRFEYFLRQFSSHIQVLRIKSGNDHTHFNAAHWERLISIHIPYLHIFDIRYQISSYSMHPCDTRCQELLEPFNSAFWLERKWFFAHRHHRSDSSNIIFYSIPHQHQ